jgi:predicted PhzF superfamily epimerase YddE/YHI9
VDLCGHATLATASYLFTDVHPEAKRLQFWSRSGWLYVERDGDGYVLDFPSEMPEPVAVDPVVSEALGVPALEAFLATDLIHVVEDAETVRTLSPDFGALAKLPVRGVVVTAAGGETGYDFVSRFFGARAGIDEDPVTGSAHSQLAPLWGPAGQHGPGCPAALGQGRHGALPRGGRAHAALRHVRAVPRRDCAAGGLAELKGG